MKKLLSTILIVILFLSVFSMVSFATESTMHIISYDFDTGSAGWYIFKSTQVLERVPRSEDSSNFCITACNEGKSYVSPALNIYDDLKSGGAGTYVINMEARYSFSGVPLIEARMVLRSEDSHSMLTSIDSEGNYYKAIGIRTDIPDSNWTNLSGSFKITEADLEEDTGEIILCLDYLFENFPEGEISIDNVTICKLDEYNITNGDFSLGAVGWRNWSNYGNFTICHNSILGFNYADYVKASTYGSIATNIDQIIAKNGCTKYEISFGIYFNEESYENLDEIVFFLTKNSGNYHLRLGQQTKDDIEAERWYTFTYTVDMAMPTAIGNLYDRLTPHTDEVFFRLEYRSAEDADSDGEQSYYIKDVSFTVAPDVTSIQFNQTKKSIYKGWEGTIDCTINGEQVSSDDIRWSSSNPSIVSIDPDTGYIKALKLGNTNIFAISRNNISIYAVCNITVTEYKQAVILLHGRSDNSANVFGAANAIKRNILEPLKNNDGIELEFRNDNYNDNSHYNSAINAVSTDNKLYTSVGNQLMQGYYSKESNVYVPMYFSGTYEENGKSMVEYNSEEMDGNLAYYLVNEKGYEPNVNLFIFNYPNEDAVVHNAIKFRIFIDNLITYVRSQDNDNLKEAFYITDQDYNNNNYRFSIVGHSMGGLVARYYIENCTRLEHYDVFDHSAGLCSFNDNHVSKLITIDTPHWGSGMADTSCNIGEFGFDTHKLCDHDLRQNSKMFGSDAFSTELNCNAFLFNCNNSSYFLTDTLNYNRQRQTRYYAIAGVTINSDGIKENNLDYELSTPFSSCDELSNYINLETNYELYDEVGNYIDEYGCLIPSSKIYFNAKIESDNIVSFLSQIGWTVDTGKNIPSKTISMHKIYIIIDSNGGNNTSPSNHFHGKVPHREDVMEKISEYLGE